MGDLDPDSTISCGDGVGAPILTPGFVRDDLGVLIPTPRYRVAVGLGHRQVLGGDGLGVIQISCGDGLGTPILIQVLGGDGLGVIQMLCGDGRGTPILAPGFVRGWSWGHPNLV